MNSINDEWKMTVVFQFDHDKTRRNVKKSYTLVNQMLGHEGGSSFLQLLKERNLAESITTQTVSSYKTLVDLIQIEIGLTQYGASQFSFILSIMDQYLATSLKWMQQDVPLFNETKQMADLSFEYAYKVPDPLDNVVELSTALIFTHDLRQVVRQTYSTELFTEIDRDDVAKILAQMSYFSCKVVLSGKDMCAQISNSNFKAKILREQQRDEWFKT